MPDLGILLAGGLAVALGAVVQSGVGLGLGLVAAPVVMMLAPSLMPGAMLVLAAVLPLFTLARDAGDADWRGLGWAFGGRAVGTPVGVWVTVTLSQRALGAVVGGMVLLAIAASVWRGAVPRNPGTLAAAGALGGVTGTATSIGGPPMALLYQRERGRRIRSTMAVFFTVGAIMSMVTLAVAGWLPQRQLAAGAALIPFMLAGFAVSGPLRNYLDKGRMRTAILLVTGASAASLIVRSLV